jgi:pimeloyl-ACP methyl ester carboxylesterase
MDQHADDLVALLDVLGIRTPVVYVGLSMGGYVGFALWRRHPEGVHVFCLLGTRATPETPLGVRHMSNMENPEAVNTALVSFIGVLNV